MHNEISLMTLSLALADATIATIVIFVACELGQRVSDAFEEIVDEFNKFHWYRFPNEMNRLLPIILITAQTPVEVEVFGGITLCRVVMKTVSSIEVF